MVQKYIKIKEALQSNYHNANSQTNNIYNHLLRNSKLFWTKKVKGMLEDIHLVLLPLHRTSCNLLGAKILLDSVVNKIQHSLCALHHIERNHYLQIIMQ